MDEVMQGDGYEWLRNVSVGVANSGYPHFLLSLKSMASNSLLGNYFTEIAHNM